jgi:O-antigen ligase
MPSSVQLVRAGECLFAALALLWLGEVQAGFGRALEDRDLVVAFFAACVALLAVRRRELRALLACAWPLLLPVLAAALSPAWSLAPQRSLRAAVSLEAATAFGLWLALRFDPAAQLRLLAATLALAAAGSVLAVAAGADFAVMTRDYPGAWNGLYIHKNVLARYLSLGVLACGLLACAERRARAWALPAAALAFAMLAPARSIGGAATLALAAGATVLIAGLARLAPRARRRAGLAALALLALAAAFVLARFEALVEAVGRDVTLTRRTEIWALLLEPILERPWLGHGFGAFWNVAPADALVVRALRFDPQHAHNGLLDLALELGVVGLAAFAVPFALAAARAVRLTAAQRGALAAWPLALLAWWLAGNLAESALLRGGRLGWAVFVAVAATLAGRARRGQEET